MPEAKPRHAFANAELSLRAEELQALRTAFIGRSVALLLIFPLVTGLTPWPGPLFVYVQLTIFLILGWGAWYVASADWGKLWHQYAFVTADFVLLSFTLLYPNPFLPLEFPPQFAMRFGTFVYFFILLAGLTYVYRPGLVLWGGFSGAVSWAIGTLWLLNMPDTVWEEPEERSIEGILALFANPSFVDLGVRVQEIAVLLLAAGLLALAVMRSRSVAVRQASLARQRENLARYFPRKTVGMLADRDNPFSEPREHKAGVLFADLVAFTRWSEMHGPSETIKMLREIHGLIATVVFRHDGTLDKFIGDGVMATFGTPEPTDNDASNALAAMIDLADSFETWRSHQQNPAAEGLKLAIGVHYGPVVIGDIGSNERLEFAVLGDTVNVAARLEQATRQVGCTALASQALIDAARSEKHASDVDTERLMEIGSIELRGRSESVDVSGLYME